MSHADGCRPPGPRSGELSSWHLLNSSLASSIACDVRCAPGRSNATGISPCGGRFCPRLSLLFGVTDPRRLLQARSFCTAILDHTISSGRTTYFQASLTLNSPVPDSPKTMQSLRLSESAHRVPTKWRKPLALAPFRIGVPDWRRLPKVTAHRPLKSLSERVPSKMASWKELKDWAAQASSRGRHF